MKSAYVERLQTEFDEITDAITTVLERATVEQRDLSDAEDLWISRHSDRRDKIEAFIKQATALHSRTERVAQVLDSTRTTPRRIEW